MLRTNDKYKADYIIAINEKRKVAVAQKRSRNKRIVCFSLAFLLMVGVLSAVMLSKPEKSSTPNGDTNVLLNTSSGEEEAKPTTSTDDPPAERIVIYADTNFITSDGFSYEPDLGEISHHHDLDYEDGKLYHVYLDVYFPAAYMSPELFSELVLRGFNTTDKYGACYHCLEVNGLEKYLDIFTREMNDRFNIDNAEDYIVVEEGRNGKISPYFDHYKLRLDYIKEYCLKYWSEAEHGEALSELKSKGISEEWVEKYGYIWWKRYDASWYCEESNSKYDIIVYDMLEDMGIVCERNEYGYPIFDIAKEDFDMLLTLPCAYDVYLLEKGTTPEAIYKVMMETDFPA